MRKKEKRYSAFLITAFLVLGMAVMLAACSGGKDLSSPYEGRPTVDISGYKTAKDYGKESRFVDTTVKEIARYMDQGKTFCFVAAYEDCKFCDRMITYLNDAATDAGQYMGYLDTRKDPSWKNNTDIDDYDLFCKKFAEYLEVDGGGKPHLYTPDAYFIKDGKVAGRHTGSLEGADDPDRPLTKAQEETLRNELANEFRSIERKNT